MQISTSISTTNEIEHGTAMFYQHVLKTLNSAGVPYLVGGAYAFHHYTGIIRDTKDLDLFIRRRDFDLISAALQKSGYRTELTYPHWLGKLFFNGDFIDLIFSSGNGVAEVDDAWFEFAPQVDMLGVPVRLSPAEEMIWSKSFIMERERFDGADIAHLLRTRAEHLDWQRMLGRFDTHWRILLCHVILFGFIYPDERELIPAWVVDELLARLRIDTHTAANESRICFGTLLSREQFLPDIARWGYRDARLVPHGHMTEQETVTWTDAIKNKH
ncbi:nucleotidyltransferase domain-containing protein [Noviherbaspirillum sp.]|uniref:nucleotidyltransferase domain-containing protein n=1 Tax=Noviherbaspirillum sp. TaxID=1926288 RepID=UPI002B45C9EE|nr:nucleotidyltransferase [Noviherbaspirillum sp.]HJV83730.1 nucleotidyltransferase [Noviherbaspirillum sp.]